METIYTDEDGYKRIKHSNLIHRQIAYHEIYKRNRDKYPLPFREYQVHHKDGNKSNNNLSNLQIVTKQEHKEIHEKSKGSKFIRLLIRMISGR